MIGKSHSEKIRELKEIEHSLSDDGLNLEATLKSLLLYLRNEDSDVRFEARLIAERPSFVQKFLALYQNII